MRNRLFFRFCITILMLLFIAPYHYALAEEKEADYFWGDVSYDDYSGVTDDNMGTYKPKDCDNYEITLDARYKLHIKLGVDITTKGSDGTFTFSITQNEELSKGFYEDIYLSRYDESRNNIIEIELDPGTYQLQVAFVSGESDSVSYNLSVEYTRINSKTEAMEDNATISFASKSYTLTMDKSDSYDFDTFEFYEEVKIKSRLEYDPSEISWKSSNKKIASVDKEGSITAHAPGTITLTATLPNGKKASCEITVPDPTYKLNKTKGSIYAGASITLKIIANPTDQQQKVQWESFDKSIASVSKTGKVTGKKSGKCFISATLPNGTVLLSMITVKNKPEIIDVADYLKNPTALLKKQNDSFEFTYKNGVITYAKITGEDATFYGLNPGEVNMASFLIPDYELISSETVFMGKESVYKKKATGEMIYITESLLTIYTIEYYR